ncbi:hypothetical protein PpBr36_05495 [Pyricularia pennisetigena]|uniref:hypothetical protein n=1 Tax=Pyricularia pennisetigena TaxID=1578925 RepID=UPI00114E306A|nr:hypothetical protein PpBr36_05495 [Pyricularia pennisetigena]TLS26547.1 hypothetical protein PpBr36_05495 [Pyricularia pennisetigena]
MEDPWAASPWTTPAPENDRGPEPPPRAFLTSTTTDSLPGLEFTSPWGGDDDSNWASGSLNVWGNGATDNPRSRSRENSVQSLAGSRPRSRDNSVSGRAWPIASPGLAAKTLSRSSSNSVLRLPGTQLDPWASDTSLELPPSPPKAAVSPGFSAKFNPQDTIPEASPDPDEFKELEVGSPQWGRDKEHSVVEIKDTTTEETDRRAQDSQEEASDQNGKTTRSRASTSCSDDSRQDTRPQDSPITSIDEDSRLKPLPHSPMQRKVSAKVSDLAKMFDSAGKSSPATSIPRPIPSTRKNFKELVEVARVSSTTTATTVATSIPRPLPATRASFQTLVEAANISTQPELPATSVPRPPPPTRTNFQELIDKFGSVQYQQELTDKYGDVQFTADLKAVDELFEKLDLRDSTFADPEDADVSDRIITDTFSSISERRVWYRVSRQGTKRLHDAGGDDYYRRVTWRTSEVRNDTFKIVRRWMEEDAFTGGRSHLRGYSGGANKAKGAAFGWDSSVPDEPVNLDEVFKKKRQSAPPAPRKVDQTPAPAMASFGWSSTPSAAPSNGFSWSTSMMDAAKPPAPNGGPRPVSMFATSKPLDPPSLAPGNKEEDDDWGEMVTSPGANGNTIDPAFSMIKNLDPRDKANADVKAPAVKSATPVSSDAIQPAKPPKTASTPAASQPSDQASTAVSDPWDLSFFGAPDPPAPASTVGSLQPVPTTGIKDSTPRSHSPLPADSKPRKMVSFEGMQDPADDAYEDEVRRVVRNLPDLTYMLG